jgi:hypothetical protein
MNKKELRKEFDKRVYLVQSAVTPDLQRKRINEAFDWIFDLIKQAGINTNVGGPASAEAVIFQGDNNITRDQSQPTTLTFSAGACGNEGIRPPAPCFFMQHLMSHTILQPLEVRGICAGCLTV